MFRRTQSHAHHQCLQRWINEKGHLRCEVCDRQYTGNFHVTPSAGPADGPDLAFSPLFALRMEHGMEPRGDRQPMDFLVSRTRAGLVCRSCTGFIHPQG
jgi:hypothetical protein